MRANRHTRILTAAGLIILILAAGLFWGIRRHLALHKGPRISKVPDGVLVDLETVYSQVDPFHISVPLEYLGLRAADINDFKTNCSCTIPALDHKATEIRIDLNLAGKSGDFRQSVAVIPNDRTLAPKIVHITGRVVPPWCWQPSIVSLDAVRPDEVRAFECLVAIQYDVTKVVVRQVALSPPLEHVAINASVADGSKIMIAGRVRGTGQKSHYKGLIRLAFDTEVPHELSIPLEINSLPVVQVTPEVVTLSSDTPERICVRFRHYLGGALTISAIEAPPCIHVSQSPNRPNSSFGQILLSLNHDKLPRRAQPESVDIKILFSGIKHPVLLPVLII